MLRCTLASLIPLMMSQLYAEKSEEFLAGSRKLFDDVIEHGSYYILRDLPSSIAKELLLPVLPELLRKQTKAGMWRGKDAGRATWDALAALKHVGLLEGLLADERLIDPRGFLVEDGSYYAILLRKHIFGAANAGDAEAAAGFIAEIRAEQKENGSWGDTVIGTAYHLERLINLGVPQTDAAISSGVSFLLCQYHETLQGMHTRESYGFSTTGMFTAEDRNSEFDAAERYYPEWISRKICFRHLAVIQNAIGLKLLLRLGMEPDARVQRALDNLYDLYVRFGGHCASNIKKQYISGACRE